MLDVAVGYTPASVITRLSSSSCDIIKMPTVLRADGFVIKIHFNDHAPAHVHVFKADGEAVFTLEPVRILRFWRMNRSDLASAKRIVNENQTVLIDSWNRIHGEGL